MSDIKINNFARTTIAVPCTDTDLEIDVADASIFPSITGDEYFLLVIENATLDREIVKCTGKAANKLTVTRQFEDAVRYPKRAWGTGDRVALRLTAGTLEARIAESEAIIDTRLDAVEADMTTVEGRIRIGEVIAWPTEALPTNFLECDGAPVLRSGVGGYPDLFAIIGTRYGSGDGVTTFNLPDYRGEFLRGYDHTKGSDPDRASRTNRGDGTTGDAVGTRQAEAARPLPFSLTGIKTDWSNTADSNSFWPYDSNGVQYTMNTSGYGTGNEIRPRNVNVMWCIRYA
jgi:hypothetical protein